LMMIASSLRTRTPVDVPSSPWWRQTKPGLRSPSRLIRSSAAMKSVSCGLSRGASSRAMLYWARCQRGSVIRCGVGLCAAGACFGEDCGALGRGDAGAAVLEEHRAPREAAADRAKGKTRAFLEPALAGGFAEGDGDRGGRSVAVLVHRHQRLLHR